jgi:hypothetical protein
VFAWLERAAQFGTLVEGNAFDLVEEAVESIPMGSSDASIRTLSSISFFTEFIHQLHRDV